MKMKVGLYRETDYTGVDKTSFTVSILDSEEIWASQVDLVKPAKCSESSNPVHVRHGQIELSRRLMAIS